MPVCIAEEICKGCSICVANCPRKTLAISSRRNAKGAQVAEQAQPEKCVACGRCRDICPDLAIWVDAE